MRTIHVIVVNIVIHVRIINCFIFSQIVFKPRSGVLGQSVLFNFGTFYMMRCLCVHVVNEQDRRTLLHVPISQKKIGTRPVKM